MKVLFAALKYDYNDISRGYSFEYENFYKTLINMSDVETIFFDISDFNDLDIRKQNNKELLSLVQSERPDIFFYMPYQDNIYTDVLKQIKVMDFVKSICWFSDDHWRFDTLTKELCHFFDYCITTDRDSIEKYRSVDYYNVIPSQWACNHHDYKKLNCNYKYDVTFVGQPHSNRRSVIEYLEKNGINVQCFGYGWKQNRMKRAWNKVAKKLGVNRFTFSLGRITQEDMIRVFNESKININLSNSSNTNYAAQIKGRNFEVPGCGGFLITDEVAYLNDYYVIGEETVTYKNLDELVEKIKYYLSHDEERERIANNGYMRTIKCHTYEIRFREIFNKVLQN